MQLSGSQAPDLFIARSAQLYHLKCHFTSIRNTTDAFLKSVNEFIWELFRKSPTHQAIDLEELRFRDT